MPQTANSYVELIGAELIMETEKGYMIAFGNVEQWFPKSKTKQENDKIYIERWLANTRNLHGEYVSGTQRSRMKPKNVGPIMSITQAIELIEQGLTVLKLALRENDKNNEKETNKVMNTIRKHSSKTDEDIE